VCGHPGYLEAIWENLGTIWENLGTIWENLGTIWGNTGTINKYVGTIGWVVPKDLHLCSDLSIDKLIHRDGCLDPGPRGGDEDGDNRRQNYSPKIVLSPHLTLTTTSSTMYVVFFQAFLPLLCVWARCVSPRSQVYSLQFKRKMQVAASHIYSHSHRMCAKLPAKELSSSAGLWPLHVPNIAQKKIEDARAIQIKPKSHLGTKKMLEAT